MESITITCADCGATQTIPPLPPGAAAECHRCDRQLARRSATGYRLTLACAAAEFILLPPAVFLPLLDSTINLVFGESRLVTSVPVIYSEVWWFPFAFGFFFFAVLFPALHALFLVIALALLP